MRGVFWSKNKPVIQLFLRWAVRGVFWSENKPVIQLYGVYFEGYKYWETVSLTRKIFYDWREAYWSGLCGLAYVRALGSVFG